MRVEVLCTGDELLTGLIADTNSPFFLERLLRLGEKAAWSTSVGDVRADIEQALTEISLRADAALVCGGLGPTADDFTLECAAKAAGVPMEEDPQILERLRERFAARGIAFTPNNARQAFVPRGAQAVHNPVGTAPMVVQKIGRCTFFFLPGVPREYKHLVEHEVLPRLEKLLAERPDRLFRSARVIKTVGLPESHLDHRVSALAKRHPQVVFGFRTHAPENHLKLLASGRSQAEADQALAAAERESREILGAFVFGADEDSFPGSLIRILAEKKQTLALAESCTGGLVAELLTSVPGSSEVFLGSAVTYHPSLKTRWAGVPPGLIEEKGVVSSEVAEAMAQGARRSAEASWGVGITGVAGPGGGTAENPVGTVYIGLAGSSGVESRRTFLGGDRERIRHFAAYTALDMLRHRVLGTKLTMSKKSKTPAAASPLPAEPPPSTLDVTRPERVVGPERPTKEPASSDSSLLAAAKMWLKAYQVELGIFLVSFFVLACFSGTFFPGNGRFLRQSGAPQFVYQAKAWLEGRLDVDAAILPNIEDWACVRMVEGVRQPCPVLPGAPGQSPDPRWFPPAARWYSSFPWFPAVVMLPFVAVNGYQFNDTSFGCFVGALAIALFYSLLRFLTRERESERTQVENVIIAAVLGFGTLFFYCAIRGEVWFSAEVMGVALTCLYVRHAVGARRPVLAGLLFSMATLTRTPLMFAGLFFVLEALCPGPNSRWEQLKTLAAEWQNLKPAAKKIGLFGLGAAPLAIIAGAYNMYRFGSAGEFGHSFLYFNRVNKDIELYGLFHPHYLERNLQAAFFKMPEIHLDPFRLGYDPYGLSLLLTLPLLIFIFVPRVLPKLNRIAWVLLVGLPLVAGFVAKDSPDRVLWIAGSALPLLGVLIAAPFKQSPPRLHWPLWLTLAVVAMPGLFYQWTGYMQFGFRFSLDYTPYVLLLFALSAWKLKDRIIQVAMGVGFAVNLWGAVAFRGYTELFYRW